MSHVLIVELYVGGVREITRVVIISPMPSTHVKYEHVFMMPDILLMGKMTQTLVMQMRMPFGSLRLKKVHVFVSWSRYESRILLFRLDSRYNACGVLVSP